MWARSLLSWCLSLTLMIFYEYVGTYFCPHLEVIASSSAFICLSYCLSLFVLCPLPLAWERGSSSYSFSPTFSYRSPDWEVNSSSPSLWCHADLNPCCKPRNCCFLTPKWVVLGSREAIRSHPRPPKSVNQLNFSSYVHRWAGAWCCFRCLLLRPMWPALMVFSRASKYPNSTQLYNSST